MRVDAGNRRERWTTIELCIVLLTLLVTLGACGGGSGTSYEPQPVETYVEPEPAYSPEPVETYVEPEPAYSPEPTGQLVTTMSGTGGSYPTVQAGSDALGTAADTKAESESFSLSGGDVELRWTVEGEDGLMYLIAEWENLDTGGRGLGGGEFELETDFANSESRTFHKDPGEYVMHVASVNCDWSLEVWEYK